MQLVEGRVGCGVVERRVGTEVVSEGREARQEGEEAEEARGERRLAAGAVAAWAAGTAGVSECFGGGLRCLVSVRAGVRAVEWRRGGRCSGAASRRFSAARVRRSGKPSCGDDVSIFGAASRSRISRAR